MLKKFKKEPKPVYWGNKYRKEPGQTAEEALQTSYPELLKERTEKYEQIADVVIDYPALRKQGITIVDSMKKREREKRRPLYKG
jgi:hypothetical protein